MRPSYWRATTRRSTDVTAIGTIDEKDFFWKHAEVGELHACRCLRCERLFLYPRMLCPFCRAQSLEWQRLPNRALVITHSTVHRLPRPDWRVPVPYVVAMVGWSDYRVSVACRLIDAAIDQDLCDTSVVFRPSKASDGLQFAYEPQGRKR